MKTEKTISKKSLLAWVREILSRHEEDLTDLPEAPQTDAAEKAAEKLIEKAAGESQDTDAGESQDTDAGESQDTDAGEGNKTGEATKEKEGCRCAYALRRNIVTSMQEIRKFADEHHLTATIVKALLTLLAEIAVGALKGKVGEKALDTLLKALNYSQHIEEAFLRGKNEAITTEYFPESGEIPHLGGKLHENPDTDDIFSMAKECR